MTGRDRQGQTGTGRDRQGQAGTGTDRHRQTYIKHSLSVAPKPGFSLSHYWDKFQDKFQV